MSEQKESVRDSDLEEGELSSDEEEEPLTVSDAASIYNVATSVYEQITMSESSDKEVEIDRIIEEAQQCLIAGNNPLLESNQHGAVSSTSVLSTMSTIPSLSIVSVWSQEGSDIAETNKEANTVAEVETSVDRDPLVSVNALEVGPSAQSASLADSGDADDMDALRMAALQSLRISRAREDGEVSDDNGDSGGRTSASRSRCDSAMADKQSTSSVVPVTKKSASKDTLDVEPRRELSNRKRRVSATSGRRRTSPSSSTSLGRDPSEDRSKRSRRNEGTGRERRHHDRESSPIGVGHKSSRRRYRRSRSPAASYKPASPSRVSSSKSKSKPLKRDSVLSKLSSSVVVTRTITNDAALANAVREPSIGSIVDEDDAGALERGPSQRTIASGNTSQALLVTVSRETAPAPVTSAGGMAVNTAAITTDAHATNPASVSDGRRRHRSHVDMVLGEDTMDTVPAEPVPSKKAPPPSADTIKITRLMALTPPPPPPLPPLPAAQSAAVFIPQSPPPPPPPLDPTEDDVKPDMNTAVQPSHNVQRTVSNIPIAAGVPVTHADNYEDVGMDIASSSDTTSRDCTRPPTRQRIVSETDENALRNLLLMQLQERRQTVPDNVSSSGRPATADSLALSNEDRGTSSSALPPRKRRSIESTGSRSPMMGETPGSYKKKLREVARLDRQMQTRFHQMEQMTAEREKLMRRVGELTNQLGEYREEYWQKSEERDRLRRDARRYERQRMRTMVDNSHLVHLNSAIEREQERARELSDRYEQMECDSASEDEEEDEGEEENAEETRDHDNMDQEMAADCDRQHESMEVSMNEDELRRMLLERMNAKQSADGEGRERDSVPVEETQTEPEQNTSLDVVAREQGLTIENSAPMSLAEHSEEVVARECGGSRDADAYTPPLSGDDEAEMRPRERQFTGLVGGVPRRLLRHMQCSSETESRLDPLLEICPFELMGTCKDYSCEYQHTRDHELPLRDVMLMVLQYAPQLAGEHLQYSIAKQCSFELTVSCLRDQLDSVLGSRLSGESNQAFVGRILGRLDGVERRELIDNSVQDETGDFDNYYSTLQIGAR